MLWLCSRGCCIKQCLFALSGDVHTHLCSTVKGNWELLSALLTDQGWCMPESRFVSACSSFSLHSLLCVSPFSLPFFFVTLERSSSVPFLLACFVLSRCATRGHHRMPSVVPRKGTAMRKREPLRCCCDRNKTSPPEPPIAAGCFLTRSDQLSSLIPPRFCASGCLASWPRRSPSNWSPS